MNKLELVLINNIEIIIKNVGTINSYILNQKFSNSLKLKIKGNKINIPPAGDGIPSKKLSFHDGSSPQILTLNLASLKSYTNNIN